MDDEPAALEAAHEMACASVAVEIVAGRWNRSDFYIPAPFGLLYVTMSVRRAHAVVTAVALGGDADVAEAETAQYPTNVGPRTVRYLHG